MRISILLTLLSVVAFGCSDNFVTNELDIESGNKTRPFAIVCDPPEASPGDTVNVTLHCFEPDQGGATVSWSLVLDYYEDLYGEQAYERDVVDLHSLADIPPMTFDSEGVGVQTFRFVVPENVMLLSSSLDESYDEPMPEEIRDLFQPDSPDYLTREEINAGFATIDPASLSESELFWVRGLSDIFACQIRLHAMVQSAIQVDITKNMTIRYSNHFESENVNHNPSVNWVAVLAVHKADLEDSDDIGLYDIDTTYIYHRDPAMVDEGAIAVDRNLTYYLKIENEMERYLSPAGNEQEEQYDYNWYYERLYSGPSAKRFYTNETGEDDPDMNELDEIVRIDPPAGAEGKEVRVFVVVRDYRFEWLVYDMVPGATYITITVEFVAP